MQTQDGTLHYGVDPQVGEEQVVTFSEMQSGDRFTLAGITVIATGTVSATDLRDFFSGSNTFQTDTAPTNATVSGLMTGYDTNDQSTTATTLRFVNHSGRNDSKHLASTDPGGGTDGTDHAVAADVSVVGIENAGAYGDGALFLGQKRINVTSVANAAQAISSLEAAIIGAAA